MADQTAVFKQLAVHYRRALLHDVIPFWEDASPDPVHGGYFTSLDREGAVYDTDKFVWLQARQVWTFSMLYDRLDRKDAWRDTARNGYRFLQEHGRDSDGNWYFSLDRTGRPLVQPYNIFSDCFAAMGLAQYGIAADDDEAVRSAADTFGNIMKRRYAPKGTYEKTVPGTRPLQSFALPMILANLVLELEPALDAETVARTLDECVTRLEGTFLAPDTGVFHEHVLQDGSRPDTFEGRLVCPGHGLEACWFLMDIAQRNDDTALFKRACGIALRTLEYGWDREHGGLFYFVDSAGKPPLQLEWDRKLWWVHLEALVALAMGWAQTGDSALARWFHKVHDWTWKRFPDPGYGEWFGYLDRRGTRISDAKGGKWKGCFHVPRALYRCTEAFTHAASGDTTA